MRRFHSLLRAPRPPELFLALLLCAAAAGRAADERRGELWYVLELGGRPAGWSVERWRLEDGKVVTETEVSVRLARGEAAVTIALAGRFEETAGGEPLVLWTRRALGSAPVETTYRFGPEGIAAESAQEGRVRREAVAAPEGEWLTPAEARRAVARHHAAGDAEYSLRVLDPLEGPEPVTLRRTRLGAADGPGGAGRWREELSTAPGVVSTVELDRRGELVRSVTEILGMEAVLRRSDRETALAALPAGGRPGAGSGPEVLLATLVRPDRPIADPRGVREAVYELDLPEGDLPELPSAGGQRVERRGDSLRVRVAAGAAGEPARRPPPPDSDAAATAPPRPALLAASLYLDHEDPEIRRLLERFAPGDADPGAARDERSLAAALTSFVHGFVREKSLDTGFATASEVARSRSGDCTEHAVLLAALLRAAEVPSRVVTGLVYLEELAGAEAVFGYHMWVQAWIDGRWLDLDATLPWGFDATHIALAVSDLEGPGGAQDLDRMLPLVGKLEIRVVELHR